MPSRTPAHRRVKPGALRPWPQYRFGDPTDGTPGAAALFQTERRRRQWIRSDSGCCGSLSACIGSEKSRIETKSGAKTGDRRLSFLEKEGLFLAIQKNFENIPQILARSVSALYNPLCRLVLSGCERQSAVWCRSKKIARRKAWKGGLDKPRLARGHPCKLSTCELQARNLELWQKSGKETALVTEGDAVGDTGPPPQAVRSTQTGDA